VRSADADGGDDAVANGAELHATPTETMNVTVTSFVLIVRSLQVV
jgi:hypothetical protein